MRNKEEYLKELERLLYRLPKEERDDILYDYQEHFTIGLQQGLTEAEIIQKLGHPKAIARELLASYHIQKAKSDVSFDNVLRAVIATIGLGFFNLVFLLGPFLAITGIIIALYAVAFSLITAAIAVLLAEPLSGLFHFQFSAFGLEGISKWLVSLFSSMILGGLGVLIGIGTIYISKGFYSLTLKYLQSNLKMITKSEE
ncbi:MAG: DUF1700 domain-containing protein [Bacillaceae bacterium]|nr:DUF1700 domain-containing protein [Bacillaceae bacterium]